MTRTSWPLLQMNPCHHSSGWCAGGIVTVPQQRSTRLDSPYVERTLHMLNALIDETNCD